MSKCKSSDAFYFADFGNGLVLDAASMGSIARFANHSCNPNSSMQRWMVQDEPHVVLMSDKFIPCDTEITYNYGYSEDGLGDIIKKRQVCMCGFEGCAGTIGGKLSDSKSYHITKWIEKASHVVLLLDHFTEGISNLHMSKPTVELNIGKKRLTLQVVESLRQEYDNQDYGNERNACFNVTPHGSSQMYRTSQSLYTSLVVLLAKFRNWIEGVTKLYEVSTTCLKVMTKAYNTLPDQNDFRLPPTEITGSSSHASLTSFVATDSARWGCDKESIRSILTQIPSHVLHIEEWVVLNRSLDRADRLDGRVQDMWITPLKESSSCHAFDSKDVTVMYNEVLQTIESKLYGKKSIKSKATLTGESRRGDSIREVYMCTWQELSDLFKELQLVSPVLCICGHFLLQLYDISSKWVAAVSLHLPQFPTTKSVVANTWNASLTDLCTRYNRSLVSNTLAVDGENLKYTLDVALWRQHEKMKLNALKSKRKLNDIAPTSAICFLAGNESASKSDKYAMHCYCCLPEMLAEYNKYIQCDMCMGWFHAECNNYPSNITSKISDQNKAGKHSNFNFLCTCCQYKSNIPNYFLSSWRGGEWHVNKISHYSKQLQIRKCDDSNKNSSFAVITIDEAYLKWIVEEVNQFTPVKEVCISY